MLTIYFTTEAQTVVTEMSDKVIAMVPDPDELALVSRLQIFGYYQFCRLIVFQHLITVILPVFDLNFPGFVTRFSFCFDFVL